MDKQEFITKVKTAAGEERKKFPMLRKGQAIFNEVDKSFNIARTVQFNYGIDCFYDDSMIEPFLDKCYEIYSKRLHV